ncbi:MAG: glycosyltransferase family 2 protein [Microthrixaceae bacterium]
MHNGPEQPKVSVVVPAFNAGATLVDLIPRLLQVLEATYVDHELIVVDDGSHDDTWKLISDSAKSSGKMLGVQLVRNFGQTPALCAGISKSSGDVVVTMDADFDTYPEDIPRLVDAVLAGADVANGVREGRSLRRSLPSRVFNRRMHRAGVGYADIGCGMVAMRRGIALEALEHGELRRSFKFKILLGALATNIAEVPVRSGPYSSSSHRLADLFSAGLEADLAQRRTIFLGVATGGAAMGSAGAITAITALVVALVRRSGPAWMVAGWGSLVALLGALLCFVAIVGNLILRSAFQQATPFFRVGDTVNEAEQPDQSRAV